jgi:hypothetical protein
MATTTTKSEGDQGGYEAYVEGDRGVPAPTRAETAKGATARPAEQKNSKS